MSWHTKRARSFWKPVCRHGDSTLADSSLLAHTWPELLSDLLLCTIKENPSSNIACPIALYRAQKLPPFSIRFFVFFMMLKQ
jgi:hypothetical protein